jgi:adenylylsulfate kinase-like enzyme
LPVLWLSGPPGVGKTTVAWELFERLGRRGLAVGHVDIDQLGMCPEPAGDPGRHRLKARALAAVAANFRDAGAQCLVVPGVTDPGRGPEPVPNTELTTCRLRADTAELRRRIIGRGGMTDLVEALEHAEAADLVPGAWVDTTGLSVSEVADRVLDRTGWPDPPAPAPKPLERCADPGEILLLCGPAAVGKSTVGWQVYQQLLRGGRNAAFADLDQISFHRPELGDHFRAANLAAVWQTFRAAGADCLVAVGPLEDPAAYPTAFPAATITLCCLDAGHEVLLDRATRRARGDSPAPGLAGDTLLGQPPDRLREIADQAARTVEAMRGKGDLHVRTDHRRPDEIAAEILRKTGYFRAERPLLPRYKGK